jgi:hypothetical protein
MCIPELGSEKSQIQALDRNGSLVNVSLGIAIRNSYASSTK